MSKTMPDTNEDRIAARIAERAALRSGADTRAREEAEDSLAALNDLIEIGARIKADLTAFALAADRVFMPAADAGLAIIRGGATVTNVGLIIDAVTATATASKSVAEALLATPAVEA